MKNKPIKHVECEGAICIITNPRIYYADNIKRVRRLKGKIYKN